MLQNRPINRDGMEDDLGADEAIGIASAARFVGGQRLRRVEVPAGRFKRMPALIRARLTEA
jgi:hypothetical protein